MSLRGYLFLKLKTAKNRFLQYLKSPMSQQLWTVNMLKGPKQGRIWKVEFFSYFLIIHKENQLKKFCFSSI